MRTIIAAILFCTFSFCAFSQDLPAANQTNGKESTKSSSAVQLPMYRCPVCGYKSSKTGQCPMDKSDLVKVGDYYCPECYMSAGKAGKCAMCGVPMKQMTATGTVK